MHSVLSGQIREPACITRLPRGLRWAIFRGLQLRPEHRHRSMSALLAALDRAVEPRARAWFVPSLLAAGVVAAIGGAAYQNHEAARACDDRGAAEIAAVWSPERAAAIGAALRAVEPLADQAWPRAEARLDAYASAWQRGSVEACTDGEIRRVHSDAFYALRRACLDDRLQALRATLELFERPESTVAIRAADLAAGLAPIASCADPQEVQRQAPPGDPQEAGRIADLRAALARAEAMRRATLFTAALASLEELTPQIPGEHMPLRAELELTRGRTFASMGRPRDALTALQTAYFTGLEANQDPQAIAAATALVRLNGETLSDFDAAKRWIRHAQALLARSGNLALRADLASAEGTLDYHTGRYADAQAHFVRALDLYAQAGLQDTPDAGMVHRVLADVALAAGNLELAQSQLDSALALLTHEYCESHPEVAAARSSAGALAMRRGDLEGALVDFQRARQGLTGVVGEDNKIYLTLTLNAANAHMKRGELELAEALTRGTLHAAAKRSDGLPGTGQRLDPERYSLRVLHIHILRRQGRLDTAEAEARTLLADAERAWGLEEPYVSSILAALAEVVLAAGRPAEALPLAERAYKLADTSRVRVQPELRSRSGFVLARILAEVGEPRRAGELARASRSLADSVGDQGLARDITTWLAERKLG